MSNRDVAPPGSARLEAMLKDYGDRLSALENRRLQGALAIQSATIGQAAIGATRTSPLRLNGAAAWTQAVEQLAPGYYGRALVTRDETGAMVDMSPTQIMQFNSNAVALNIANATYTVVDLSSATALRSSPYPVEQTFDSRAAQSCLIIPITGWYRIYATGLWNAVVDATTRNHYIEFSSDGGATYGVMAGNVHANAPQDNHYAELFVESEFQAGWRVRYAVSQRTGGLQQWFHSALGATLLRGIYL